MARKYHPHQVTEKGSSYSHRIAVTHKSQFGKDEHDKELKEHSEDRGLITKARNALKKVEGYLEKRYSKLTITIGSASLIALITILSTLPGVTVTGLSDIWCGEVCYVNFAISTSRYDLHFTDEPDPFYFYGNAILERIVDQDGNNFTFKDNTLRAGETWNLTAIISKDEWESIKYDFSFEKVFIDPMLYSEVIRPSSIDKDLGSGKRQLQILSGKQYVQEGKEWIRVEEAKSLKGEFDIIYLEEDPRWIVTVNDFNWTHLNITVESKEKEVPVRLNYGNETIEMTIKAGTTILDLSEFKTIFYFNSISFGDASTTIQLQDADTENMEDGSASGGSPTTEYGAYEYIFSGTQISQNPRHFMIKFNLSSLSNIVVEEALLNLYLVVNNLDTSDEGSNLSTYIVYQNYTVNGGEWVEGTGNPTAACTGQDFCYATLPSANYVDILGDTKKFFGGTGEPSGDQTWNVTEIIEYAFEYSWKNCSILFYTHDGFGGPNNDFLYFASKEYGTASIRPYLNITYHSAVVEAPDVNYSLNAPYIWFNNSAYCNSWSNQTVEPWLQTSGLGIFNVTNNGTATGAIQAKVNATATNYTMILGNGTANFTLTTDYQTVSPAVTQGTIVNYWLYLLCWYIEDSYRAGVFFQAV